VGIIETRWQLFQDGKKPEDILELEPITKSIYEMDRSWSRNKWNNAKRMDTALFLLGKDQEKIFKGIG